MKIKLSIPTIFSVLLTLIPFLGIAPLKLAFGFYHQTEILYVGYWLCGAFSALMIARSNDTSIKQAIYNHPLIYGPLILGSLSLVLTPFSKVPLLNLTGSLQLGDGALTIISCGLISWYLITHKDLINKKLVLVSLITAILTISALTTIGSAESYLMTMRYWDWAPYFYVDFIAFLSVAAAGGYISYRPELKTYRWLIDAFMSLLVISTSYYASNRSLGYGFCIALFVYGLTKIPVLNKKYRTQLLIFGTLFGISGVLIFFNFFKSWPIFQSLIQSIGSRTQLIHMGVLDFFQWPTSLSDVFHFLFGYGHGSYEMKSYNNLGLLQNLHLFDASQTFKPNVEYLERDLLNTHNILFEIFNATGLVGVSVSCFCFYKLIQSFSKDRFALQFIYLVTLLILCLFWFQPPTTWFYLTLVNALIFQGAAPLHINFPKAMRISLALISGVLFIGSLSATILSCGLYKVSLKSNEDILVKIKELEKSYLFQLDKEFGSNRVRFTTNNYFIDFVTHYKHVKPKYKQEYYQYMLMFLKSFKLPPHTTKGNPVAQTNIMRFFDTISVQPEFKQYLEPTQPFAEMYNETAFELQKAFPRRPDLLSVYFSFLVQQKRYDTLRNILKQYPQQNHPIIQWYQGVLDIMNDRTFKQGMCSLKKAIKNDVAKLIPIPQKDIGEIRDYSVVCD